MRADYIPTPIIKSILTALMPENRLALQTSIITGIRISDVLNLKTEQVRKQRFTIREQKTGKAKRIFLPRKLQDELLSYSGSIYVFENRLNGRRHRTRQAVFKDLKRVAKAFHLKENICPHSMRKIYAVNEFKRTGDIGKVKKLLNHNDEAVTILYAMADRIKTKITKSRKKSGIDKIKKMR